MTTTDIIIWSLLIIGIIVVIVGGIFGLRRKLKAYKLHLRIDYRKPDSGGRSYYAIVDNQSKTIDYYNNLFSWKAAKYVPLVYDLASFADDQKNVSVIRSPTGKPGDNLDVPVGLPLNSQAACLQYAKSISNSVSNILQFYDVCKAKDFRVGELVTINNKIQAKIKTISYNGITVVYPNEEYAKARAANKVTDDIPRLNTETFDMDDYKRITQTMKPMDKKSLEPLSYADFFTSEWVMATQGVRKVEDANIITIPTKTAIAQSISDTNEFILDRSGFLEKHAGIVIGLLIMVFVGVTTIFIFYGANTFYSGITGDIGNLASTVHSLNTGLASTTTIPSSVVNVSGIVHGA